jgi:type IV pilus assembly protein PilW
VSPKALSRHPIGRSAASGFSLVELLVAVTIGLFISAALGAVFINSKAAFNSQDQLSQLQDSERLVMTLLSSSVQLAGYASDPTQPKSQQLTAGVALPGSYSSYNFATAGVGVFGGSAGATGDFLATRYSVAAGDGQTSCLGDAPATGTATYSNVFSVTASGDLQCTVGGGPNDGNTYPLVSGVSTMSVLYGIDPTGTGGPTQYVPTASMTAANWAAVKTARITIDFKNPYYVAGQSGQNPTVEWVTTISLMNSNQ